MCICGIIKIVIYTRDVRLRIEMFYTVHSLLSNALVIRVLVSTIKVTLLREITSESVIILTLVHHFRSASNPEDN